MPRFLFLLAWIFLADSGSSSDSGLGMDPNGTDSGLGMDPDG